MPLGRKLLAICLGALAATASAYDGRFRPVVPLPGLGPTLVDYRQTGVGIANQVARNQRLQGRVMWLDGTANLDKVDSDEKIAELMERLADIGFNTVVFDVKTIVGRTLYPSDIAPQIDIWKGIEFPTGYDPLATMVVEAERQGLDLWVSLNALSEGHSFAKRDQGPESQFGDPGWGYGQPELQTVQLVAEPILRVGGDTVLVVDRVNPPQWSDAVAVFSRQPAQPREGEFRLAVDRDGRVQPDTESIPPGGALYVGLGEGAEFLRSHAVPGRRIRTDTDHSFVRAADAQNQIPLMMNPHHPDVHARAKAIVEEILTRYDVDGLLYDDRLRFGGLDADFSELARSKFEAHVGQELKWPDDVYRVTYSTALDRGYVPGPYYDRWLAWRATEMRDFVRSVRQTVDASRPGTLFGIYAGSWFGDYPRFGSHYGSPRTIAGWPFMDRDYRKAAFGPELDVLITGCYYPIGTVAQAMRLGRPQGRTVEAGGVISNRVARDGSWTYAGIMLADHFSNPSGVEEALRAAAASTQGVMVFDLSHDFDTFEPILRRAFSQPRRAPHAVAGLLDEVRRRRAAFDAAGGVEPPVPFYEGMPGAGF